MLISLSGYTSSVADRAHQSWRQDASHVSSLTLDPGEQECTEEQDGFQCQKGSNARPLQLSSQQLCGGACRL